MTRSVEITGQVVASLLLLVAFVYVGDYAWLRYRIARGRAGDAFGTVTMERLYAIPQKNGKIDYAFDARQPEVTLLCVRSMFPHMDQSPCWYLQRNSQKPIAM